MEVEYRLPNLTSTLQIIGCHQGRFPSKWSYPWHHHFLFELLYCKEGQVWQTVGSSSFYLSTGDWLLIKSGVSHATENQSDDPYVYFNLHFDLDDPVLRSKLCESNYLIINSDDPMCGALSTHLVSIEEAFQRNSNPVTDEYDTAISRLIIQSHTLGLVSAFARHSIETPHQRLIPTGQDHESSNFETEIAHAIEEKLRNEHRSSVGEIARTLSISRGQCTRIFTQVYGQSPRQYRSRLVINQAKHLLVQTTITIEEMAEQLGFQSASHFSRQFRRWTGMPPSSFRPRYARSNRKV